jgi:hypothetical protein
VAAVEIAQFAGPRLSRRDYPQLIKAGLSTAAAAVDGADDAKLAACLGGNKYRVEIVRGAARLFHDQDESIPFRALPEYEA